MKKNNYIVIAVAAILGAFLLFLWYYLGFNKIDNPLDLALTVLWWVADAAIVAGIVHFEKKRQEQIRTIYVSPAALFNSERGVVSVPDAADRVEAMESILQGLTYDFSNEDMPDQKDFEYLYVVQTEKYEAAKKAEEEGAVEAHGRAAGDGAGVASAAVEGAAVAAAATEDATETVAAVAVADLATDASDSEGAKQPKWEGKVTRIDRENGNVETKFSSMEELAALLAA